MSRTARLLELMISLQKKSRFTVQELADEFGVSRRTMLRDLHALSEMGVPLASSPGLHGGYSLIMARRLFPLSLTVDEAIGMVLSYEGLLQYAQSPFAAQSLSAITKLRGAIPPDVVRRLDSIQQHVVVVEPARTYQAPLLPDLLQAAVDGTHLRIAYDSRRGSSERVIYPYGLFAEHGFWYCLCHDKRRNGLLVLRADRILSLEPSEGMEPPPEVSVRDWLRDRYTDAPAGLHLRARLTRVGARSFTAATLFGEIPLNEEGEGVVDAHIPATEIEYFAAQLLSLAPEVVVLSPPELIEAMCRKAQQVLALHEM